jgi:hypothetical protein
MVRLDLDLARHGAHVRAGAGAGAVCSGHDDLTCFVASELGQVLFLFCVNGDLPMVRVLSGEKEL